MRDFQEALGYFFRDGELLQTALRHSSFAHERGGLPCNERLEFLGDSVLGLTVTQLLYETYPESSEGELSALKAELVCEKALACWADALSLARVLSCGKSMRGVTPPSLYADALEAVLGAVFLDGGYEAAGRVVQRRLFRLEGELTEADESRDAKSRLQTWFQTRDWGLPRYELVSVDGPSHSPHFQVRVRLGNIECMGTGRTRKEAESSAASSALRRAQEAEDTAEDF